MLKGLVTFFLPGALMWHSIDQQNIDLSAKNGISVGCHDQRDKAQSVIMKLIGDLLHKQLGRQSTSIDWMPEHSPVFQQRDITCPASNITNSFPAPHMPSSCAHCRISDARTNGVCRYMQIDMIKESYLRANLQKEICEHLSKWIRTPGLSPINSLGTADMWGQQN